MNATAPNTLEKNTAQIKSQTYNKGLRRITSQVGAGVQQYTYTGCVFSRSGLSWGKRMQSTLSALLVGLLLLRLP